MTKAEKKYMLKMTKNQVDNEGDVKKADVKRGRSTRDEMMTKAMLQVANMKHGRRSTGDVKVTIQANNSQIRVNKSHVRENRSHQDSNADDLKASCSRYYEAFIRQRLAIFSF